VLLLLLLHAVDGVMGRVLCSMLPYLTSCAIVLGVAGTTTPMANLARW
jgi:hypothetical protein